MPLDEDGSIPGFDPSKGSGRHTLSVPLPYLSLLLSRSDPKTPPLSLSRPVTLLISLLSRILSWPPLQFHYQPVSSLSFSSLLYFLVTPSLISRGLLPATPSLPSLWFHSSPSPVFFFLRRTFLSLFLSLTHAFSLFRSLLLLFHNPPHPSRSLTRSLPPILSLSLSLSLSELGVQAAPEWQGDIVCHISIPRQSPPFSPESNYFFQSERFNLL